MKFIALFVTLSAFSAHAQSWSDSLSQMDDYVKEKSEAIKQENSQQSQSSQSSKSSQNRSGPTISHSGDLGGPDMGGLVPDAFKDSKNPQSR